MPFFKIQAYYSKLRRLETYNQLQHAASVDSWLQMKDRNLLFRSSSDRPGVMVHICNPRSDEAETGLSSKPFWVILVEASLEISTSSLKKKKIISLKTAHQYKYLVSSCYFKYDHIIIPEFLLTLRRCILEFLETKDHY